MIQENIGFQITLFWPNKILTVLIKALAVYLLWNIWTKNWQFTNGNFVIEDGKLICQMVIAKHEKAEMESVDILLDSERGVEGFGQTGKKQLWNHTKLVIYF